MPTGTEQPIGATTARRSNSRRGGIERAALSLGLLLLFLATPALGLDPERAITQFGLDAWHRKQGLPQSTVSALLQTRDGFIWLGTEEGLARFDGVRFTVFDRKNTPELRHHNVTALAQTLDGSLWIGTLGGGLKRYRDGVFSSFGPEQGLPEEIVSALAVDRRGGLWIGTFSQGVARLVNGRFTRLTTREGLAHDEVRALWEDPNGNLWIGTRGGGVTVWDGGRPALWSTREGLSNDQVTAITGDARGDVWIGTRSGLNRISGGVITVFSPQQVGSDAVLALQPDRDGNLWIGTVGGGLVRYRDGAFTAMSKSSGLSGDTVRAFLEDSDGSLWIGTSGGLDRLRPGSFTTWAREEGLSHDDVRPILEDREGNLWIGTLGGGIARFSRGVFTSFSTKDGLLSDRVWAIHQDAAGTLWVGTREGLNRYRDGKWTGYTTKDGLAHNLVLAIGSDREGNLWVGTAGGLSRWRDGRFTNYGRGEGLTNERVMAIVPDAAGTLWLGTMGGGLHRLADGRIESVPGPLESSFVGAIYPEPDGTLWIGTSGDGLFRWKQGRWLALTTREGLPDDVVFSILEDASGHLWMSSNRGVFRIAKSEVEAFASGSRREISSTLWDGSDGMKESECNGGFQPAGWRTRDGRLWFPTIRGAVVVDPAHLTAPSKPPRVLIEDVIADGERVRPDRVTRFGPEKGRFEFHYTALSYLAPEKLRFRFRLEEFDRDWVEAGSRRVAYYTNLPPGSYRFRVAAAGRDGVWTEQGAAFAFALAPRFYRTPLFLVLMSVAVLAAALWIHSSRVRAAHLKSELSAAKLEALKAQLQPHFLFNTLNTILPLIYRDPDAASRTLVQLGDLLRASLEQDATKLVPLSSELDFLGKYLDIQAVRYRSRLSAEFRVEDDVLGAAVPNLLLQPLVENAIKHGIAKHPGPGRIEITGRRDGDCLSLRVWNTAGEPGPRPQEIPYGVGLTNIQERLGVIYGKNHRFTRARENGSFEVVIELPFTLLPAATSERLALVKTPPEPEAELDSEPNPSRWVQ